MIEVGQRVRVSTQISPWYNLIGQVVGVVGELAQVVFPDKIYLASSGNYEYDKFLIPLNQLEVTTGESSIPEIPKPQLIATFGDVSNNQIRARNHEILWLIGGLFGESGSSVADESTSSNSTFILLRC